MQRINGHCAVTDEALRQLDAFSTPGTLLRAARQARGMSEREAADRLNLMPNYVALIERDDYRSLRSPAFARGYVRSYARLLELDEGALLRLFDETFGDALNAGSRRVERRPLQLQRTGTGVVVGLSVLALLVAALWWWRGANAQTMFAPGGASLTSPGLTGPATGGKYVR